MSYTNNLSVATLLQATYEPIRHIVGCQAEYLCSYLFASYYNRSEMANQTLGSDTASRCFRSGRLIPAGIPKYYLEQLPALHHDILVKIIPKYTDAHCLAEVNTAIAHIIKDSQIDTRDKAYLLGYYHTDPRPDNVAVLMAQAIWYAMQTQPAGNMRRAA